MISKDTGADGEPVGGSPHAVTVGTPDARLVWYAPIGSRSKTAIAGLGVLDGYAGYLVRDDYAGWHQFDAQLAGVQQCTAHLIRHAKGVLELHPTQQQWAGQVIAVPREAAAAVTAATADGREHLDPRLLAELRARYDHAVGWAMTTNRHRDWASGNHPATTWPPHPLGARLSRRRQASVTAQRVGADRLTPCRRTHTPTMRLTGRTASVGCARSTS